MNASPDPADGAALVQRLRALKRKYARLAALSRAGRSPGCKTEDVMFDTSADYYEGFVSDIDELLAAAPVERTQGWQREIAEERARQDAKWGGPAHDDTHTLFEWWGFIKERMVGRAFPGGAQRERQDLVEIAALAVAAVESFDRRQSWKPALTAAPGDGTERT